MEDEPLYRLIMPDGMHLANPQDDPAQKSATMTETHLQRLWLPPQLRLPQ